MVPEGLHGRRYRFSRRSLRFLKGGVEADYLAYRNPTVLRWVRWLLLVRAVLALAGSLIDITRLDGEGAWLLTEMRVAAAAGLLAA